jgi:hypothetical protein
VKLSFLWLNFILCHPWCFDDAPGFTVSSWIFRSFAQIYAETRFRRPYSGQTHLQSKHSSATRHEKMQINHKQVALHDLAIIGHSYGSSRSGNLDIPLCRWLREFRIHVCRFSCCSLTPSKECRNTIKNGLPANNKVSSGCSLTIMIRCNWTS